MNNFGPSINPCGKTLITYETDHVLGNVAEKITVVNLRFNEIGHFAIGNDNDDGVCDQGDVVLQKRRSLSWVSRYVLYRYSKSRISLFFSSFAPSRLVLFTDAAGYKGRRSCCRAYNSAVAGVGTTSFRLVWFGLVWWRFEQIHWQDVDWVEACCFEK